MEDFVNEINYFINTFDDCRQNFLNGNCYWFALILRERFLFKYTGTLMYHPVNNHFAMGFRINDKIYLFDASGLIDVQKNKYGERGWCSWFSYRCNEPSASKRIYRDCALHEPPKD